MKPRTVVLWTVASYLSVLATGNWFMQEGVGVSDPGRQLTQVVGTAVPMVHSVLAIPGGNASIAFFYAWFWAFAPLGAWAGWLYRKSASDSFGGADRSDLKLVATALMVLFFLAVALFWPVMQGSNSRRDRSLVYSVFSSLSYTSAAMGMMCTAGGVARMLLMRFRTGSPEEETHSRNSASDPE